jgi:hypothetical protein
MMRRTNKLVFILTELFQPSQLLAIKAAAHPSASALPTDIRQELAKNRTDVDKNLQGIKYTSFLGNTLQSATKSYGVQPFC